MANLFVAIVMAIFLISTIMLGFTGVLPLNLLTTAVLLVIVDVIEIILSLTILTGN